MSHPTEALIKVLGPDGRSTHGGSMQWSLPTDNGDGTWTPGEWHTVTGDLILCSNALHLTDERGVYRNWAKFGMTAYVVEERGGRATTDQYRSHATPTLTDFTDRKIGVRSARTLYPLLLAEWWKTTEHIITHEIPATPWLQPDGGPDPSWRLFTANSWSAARSAAGSAAKSAAESAAESAAWPAAWPAAWSAARSAAEIAAKSAAESAARSAARSAAKSAAESAAWSAARPAAEIAAKSAAESAAWSAAKSAAEIAAWPAAESAAWSAAESAALYVLAHGICSDLAMDDRHRRHAAARWDVWTKGYALLDDVDGVLYVYAALPS